jgi:putative addiction module component (TIGR02574 family)
MSDMVSQIISQIPSFSNKERAELAYAFVCSLDSEEADEGVEEAWNGELKRRAAEIRSGKAVGKPAAELFAELRRTGVGR